MAGLDHAHAEHPRGRREAPRPCKRQLPRPKPERVVPPPRPLTAAEHLEIDAIVCAALGKLPGESVHDAAARVMAERGAAWKVAAVVVHAKGTDDGWAVMRRAAKVARRIGGRS
jgi:hypothetical protein